MASLRMRVGPVIARKSALAWIVCAVGLLGCGEDSPERPVPVAPEVAVAEAAPGAPNARFELAREMAADLAAVRSPADGGGRAFIDVVTGTPLRAGGPARIEFVYEAGPLGVAEGGSIFFQPPLWGWSTPGGTSRPGGLAARATTDAPGLELENDAPDSRMLRIRIAGRPMEPGERLRIHYGERQFPIVVGSYAGRRVPFTFFVDGDGDGVRGLVDDPPRVDVLPGSPARLVAHLPATLKPGEPAKLRVAVLDKAGSSGVEFEGKLVIEAPGTVEVPDEVALTKADRGIASVTLVPREEGILELTVRAEPAAGEPVFETRTPPALVAAVADPVLFIDLHGHTQLSDGTGTAEDYLAYARDVAALDAVAITDHDHWGIPFLDQAEENWKEIRQAVSAAHDPGHFVALLGYEWTSWVHGHRHVVHFADDGPLFSWVDPRTDTPGELWQELQGLPSLTFAHHSAGEPVATDWRVPPDPVLEPITEIVSVHGSSEAPDTPRPVRGGIAGNYVRDALERGYRLGFVGSGDSHDGHPGLAHLNARSGGVAAVFAPERTRPAILAALRARRTYATNGPRILLDARLDGHLMGAALSASSARATGRELSVQVAAPSELAAIELVADGGVVERVEPEGRSASFVFSLPPGAPEHWLYVRVLQADGGAAWSSPWFVSAD